MNERDRAALLATYCRQIWRVYVERVYSAERARTTTRLLGSIPLAVALIAFATASPVVWLVSAAMAAGLVLFDFRLASAVDASRANAGRWLMLFQLAEATAWGYGDLSADVLTARVERLRRLMRVDAFSPAEFARAQVGKTS